MKVCGGLLGTLMLASTPALAEGPESGFIDAFLVPYSEFEATYRVPPPSIGTEVNAKGDGVGLRGMLPVWGPIVAIGEYQAIDIDRSEDGINSLRAGVGIAGESSSGVFFLYESFEIDDDFKFNGVALLGRAAGDITQRFKVYGELAYALLRHHETDNDYQGLEFSVGAAWQLTYRFGFFADYRVTSFTWSDSGYELQFDLSDARIGGRFQFGG